MFDAWFIHACTISRNAATETDDYRADLKGFAVVATGVPCRMKISQMRNLVPDLGEGPVLTRYQCYLAAGTDVQPGDQVGTVVDEEGESIAGVYKVESVFKRRARTVRHVTVELSRMR